MGYNPTPYDQRTLEPDMTLTIGTTKYELQYVNAKHEAASYYRVICIVSDGVWKDDVKARIEEFVGIRYGRLDAFKLALEHYDSCNN